MQFLGRNCYFDGLAAVEPMLPPAVSAELLISVFFLLVRAARLASFADARSDLVIERCSADLDVEVCGFRASFGLVEPGGMVVPSAVGLPAPVLPVLVLLVLVLLLPSAAVRAAGPAVVDASLGLVVPGGMPVLVCA